MRKVAFCYNSIFYTLNRCSLLEDDPQKGQNISKK